MSNALANLDSSQEGIVNQEINSAQGEFSQSALIDRKLHQKIQKAIHEVKEKTGFINTDKMFGLFRRKHHMYYGVSLCEKALENKYTTNKIEIPLLERREVMGHIQKLPRDVRDTIGWIHMGAVQIVIRATFREGLNTPITLALLDNRIKNKQEATLGILQGNLKYQKLVFTIHPKFSYHFNDSYFNKVLTLLQDFERLDFMHDGNRPYSITYQISYALSNTHHSEYFKDNEYICLPSLFQDVGQIYRPEQFPIDRHRELLLDTSDKPMLIGKEPPPALQWNDVIVRSSSIRRSIDTGSTSEPQKDIPRIGTSIHIDTGLRISAEYWNIYEWKPIDIIFSITMIKSYINPKIVSLFDKEADGLSITIKLRFGIHEIEVKALLDDSLGTDIVLGSTFLDKVQPWKVSSSALTFSIDQHMIRITK